MSKEDFYAGGPEDNEETTGHLSKFPLVAAVGLVALLIMLALGWVLGTEFMRR